MAATLRPQSAYVSDVTYATLCVTSAPSGVMNGADCCMRLPPGVVGLAWGIGLDGGTRAAGAIHVS